MATAIVPAEVRATFMIVPAAPSVPPGGRRRGGRTWSLDEVAARGGHVKMKVRRDELRRRRLCINGPLGQRRPSSRRVVAHGPVVSGGKCQYCIDVHRGSNK